MNLFKRWTTSVTTSFDWVINQVENHDALVSAAIREMQHAGAKARVQLERVKRDGQRLNTRINELREMEGVWTERALRVHNTDHERALECLQRKNQAKRELSNLENQLKEHTRTEGQLGKDLKLIDERIGELRRKKNSLNARQYRAEALKAGQLGELGIIGEIDEIFERWEIKLGQYDSSLITQDNFEDDFKHEENIQALEAELTALVAKEATKASSE